MSDGARDAKRMFGGGRRYRDATTIADANRLALLRLTHDMQERVEQMEANDRRLHEEYGALRKALGDLIDDVEGVRPDPLALIRAKATHAATKRELVS